MPKVPYPYEVNGKLVAGNGSLIPVCSLSNRSLLPSLTIVFIHRKPKIPNRHPTYGTGTSVQCVLVDKSSHKSNVWKFYYVLGPLFLCWFSGVVPFNTSLILSWEENKCCYKLYKCTKLVKHCLDFPRWEYTIASFNQKLLLKGSNYIFPEREIRKMFY